MAAANEHVAEYRAKASQFAKRMFEFLSVMFKFQVCVPSDVWRAQIEEQPS